MEETFQSNTLDWSSLVIIYVILTLINYQIIQLEKLYIDSNTFE